MGKDALCQTHDEDHRAFQPLGLMHGHQAYAITFILSCLLSLFFQSGHSLEKMTDCALLLCDAQELFKLIIAALQFRFFVMLRRLCVFFRVLLVFAIVVPQVCIVCELAYKLDGFGWLIVALGADALDERDEILDSGLVFGGDGVGLLLAELQ